MKTETSKTETLAERESRFFEALNSKQKRHCCLLLKQGYIVRPSQYFDCRLHFLAHGSDVPQLILG